MKITKTAAGKQKLSISKSEWTNIGKKAGWFKEAQVELDKGQYGEGARHMDWVRERKRRERGEEEDINGDFDDRMDPSERDLRRQRHKNHGLTDAELNEKLDPRSQKRNKIAQNDGWMDQPEEISEDPIQGNRWRIAVELTWDIDQEEIIPQYPGDSNQDYATRSLYKVKPHLDALLQNSPFAHYHILELPKAVMELD